MLVQDYLRNGKTLEDLTNEYQIGISVCEELGVVSLNYSQIASDLSNPICQECRGLILEPGSWNVVCRSYNKFFNLEEPNNAAILEAFDWSTARVLDKIDGSLIMAYYWAGKWNFATRKSPNASGPVSGYDTTFNRLIELTIEEMGFDRTQLNPDMFYSFELTTPLNRIVVPYEGYNLTWIGAWNADTLEEISIWSLPDIGMARVRQLPLSNLTEIMAMIEKLPSTEGEGVVVVDGSFRRMKIKSPEYLMAFRVVTNVEASPRNKIAFVQSENFDDMYKLLPQAMKDEINELKSKFESLAGKVTATYATIKDLEIQKDFALEATKFPYSDWLFKMRKGVNLDSLMKDTAPEKIESVLEKM